LGATNSATAGVAGVQGNNNAATIAVRANGFGGPLFVGNGSSAIDVFTVDNAGNTTILGGASVTGIPGNDALVAGTTASFGGVAGFGTIGLFGSGEGSSNPYGAFTYNDATSGGTAIGFQDASGTGVLVNGFNSAGSVKLQIQDDGTVYAHNFVIAFDTPTGQKVTNYATMSSTPNVEDFGEAQLTGGQAYVSLKQAFAGEIDARTSYMVFITPEGDTRGVYVTQKTPAGFVVRENQGGRSNAAFSYRIVAKSFGSAAATMRPGIAPPHRVPQVPTMATLHRVPKSKI
jgi:hypothetical protein